MKLTPTEEQKDQFHLIDGPVWKDECNHPPESYIASFEEYNFRTKKMDQYDLYLFPHDYHGQEVCIRFGIEPQHYISPGGLFGFLAKQNCGREPYDRACRILQNFGTVKWELKK